MLQRYDDYVYPERSMSDFPAPSKKLKEADILDLLQKHYSNTEQWAFFPRLRTGTGQGKDCTQQLDGWCIRLWGEQSRLTFEVKVSRSDFLLELKNPIKRRLGLLLSNQFYFVAPKGMIKPSEIPIECGLMEVIEGGHIFTKVQAPWRDTSPPTWHFLASIARRMAKMELEEETA
jgi:hypothetical protein